MAYIGRDFRSRAAHYSQGGSPADRPSEKPGNKPESKPCSAPSPQSGPLDMSSLLGRLDSDSLLIAALLVLLMKEGCDKRLILALGYILF